MEKGERINEQTNQREVLYRPGVKICNSLRITTGST
jgi:hypothetical protein